MERTYFFDSTEQDQRIYNAADFARFHAQIIGNGVSNTANLPDLEVTAQNNMNVGLGAGYMFANGYMYENTSTLTLTHDTADSNNDRIDRVVICFDANPEERSIKAVILKGTPASNPVPPPLQRDNYVYQMSVAQVRIIKGKSFIEQSQITDERANDAVCGYIPLHNIYRGLQINDHGMVTMPNQSYVEMNTEQDLVINSTYQINPSQYVNFYHQYVNIVPLIDRQNEISNGKFTVKTSGTFQFSGHIRIKGGWATPASRKIEMFLVINGEEAKPIYLFNSYATDSQYMGQNTKYLEKGDVVELVIGRRYIDAFELNWLRLNIAKIN